MKHLAIGAVFLLVATPVQAGAPDTLGRAADAVMECLAKQATPGTSKDQAFKRCETQNQRLKRMIQRSLPRESWEVAQEELRRAVLAVYDGRLLTVASELVPSRNKMRRSPSYMAKEASFRSCLFTSLNNRARENPVPVSTVVQSSVQTCSSQRSEWVGAMAALMRKDKRKAEHVVDLVLQQGITDGLALAVLKARSLEQRAPDVGL